MKKKELNEDIGLKLKNKKARINFEDKVSLRLINKYQFRPDLDSKNNIPLHRITGVEIN